VERAWQWIDGIIESWRQSGMKTQQYVAGTWGPTDAVRLLDRDGREWRNPLDE
jgi:glucose-6-phosphate 1-dehydrogenase